MKNRFNTSFLKDYFKTGSPRGYSLAFKRFPRPIERKQGLLTSKLWEDHTEGKITLYLRPSKWDVCYWATLDFDVLEKGDVLTFERLNKYPEHLFTLKWCLNKIGLSERDYLLVLNGRGFHLHFFFDAGLETYFTYNFLKAVTYLFEDTYYKAIEREHEWSIDLRPEKASEARACIQIPGFNFIANRFSIPFHIDSKGKAIERDNVPQIGKIKREFIMSIIIEFWKK